MSKNATWCSRVSDDINCPRCSEKKVVENGRTKNNKQQYYCKICFYRFIENYTYQACKLHINQNIIQLAKEGLGIRSTARILKISATEFTFSPIFITKNFDVWNAKFKGVITDGAELLYLTITSSTRT